MRNPDRIDEIIYKVRRIWKYYPDWRLSQLLVNIIKQDRSVICPAVFYFEDDKLDEILDKWLKGIDEFEAKIEKIASMDESDEK